LIPAGGGCKEMLLRLGDSKRAFDLIGFAKISESAAQAREMGFLRSSDAISMNRERLLAMRRRLRWRWCRRGRPGFRGRTSR